MLYFIHSRNITYLKKTPPFYQKEALAFKKWCSEHLPKPDQSPVAPLHTPNSPLPLWGLTLGGAAWLEHLPAEAWGPLLPAKDTLKC